jgi:hypothetical protein
MKCYCGKRKTWTDEFIINPGYDFEEEAPITIIEQK